MYRDDGRVKGYLRAEGQRIVNGDGQELLLRGVGLGNWLLPEGYMWKFRRQMPIGQDESRSSSRT